MTIVLLVINPDECIDCALCEPECPANAICSEDDLTPDMANFLQLNAAKAKEWPTLTTHKEALPDAEQWNGVKDKLQYLED